MRHPPCILSGQEAIDTGLRLLEQRVRPRDAVPPRAAGGGAALSGSRFHDWWLAFVAASIGSIIYLPQPLVDYRQHAHTQTDLAGRRRTQRSIDKVAAKYAERERWLAELARFASPHQPQFQRMHALWAERGSAWFCPAWWRFLRAHAQRLMVINQREPFGRFAAKQFFGMRWRLRGASAAGAALRH